MCKLTHACTTQCERNCNYLRTVSEKFWKSKRWEKTTKTYPSVDEDEDGDGGNGLSTGLRMSFFSSSFQSLFPLPLVFFIMGSLFSPLSIEPYLERDPYPYFPILYRVNWLCVWVGSLPEIRLIPTELPMAYFCR
jgi:hypothetical protein